MDLAAATADDFRKEIGTTFTVRGGERPLPFVLAEVTEGMAAPGAPRNPFSIVFRGPVEPVLAQQILTLDHPELGELAIFVVPLGVNAEGTRYQAVFA